MTTSFLFKETPFSKLCEAHEDNVNWLENQLFFEASSTSNIIGAGTAKLLERIKKKSEGRAFGELIPFILGDLSGVDAQTTKKIAISWLSIYLHIVLLDDQMDRGHRPTTNELLASSFLFQRGVGELNSLLTNEKHRNQFQQFLVTAIESQASDEIAATLEERRMFALGKNYGLLGCALVFATLAKERGEDILQFTRSILLALQYLDDLADWSLDYEKGTWSVLLSMAFGVGNKPVNNCSNKYRILEKLVDSGALNMLLLETRTLVDRAINIMPDRQRTLSTSTGGFFMSLEKSLIELVAYVAETKKKMLGANQEERIVILEKLEHQLKIVAMSS